MKKIFIVLFLISFSGLLAQDVDETDAKEIWGPNTIPIAMDLIAERLELKNDFGIERVGWCRDVRGKINGVKVVVYLDLRNIKADVQLENILFEELNSRNQKKR